MQSFLVHLRFRNEVTLMLTVDHSPHTILNVTAHGFVGIKCQYDAHLGCGNGY